MYFLGFSIKTIIFQMSSFQMILILALIILQDYVSFVFFLHILKAYF